MISFFYNILKIIIKISKLKTNYLNLLNYLLIPQLFILSPLKKFEIVPSLIHTPSSHHLSSPFTLIPQVKVLNCENDEYIALLMDYFHVCFESVRKLSIGKTKHLMLKALADTIGGYLQVYILPLTKHSYYAGNIKYRNARKLFELHEQLKIFLRTDGNGWLYSCKDIKQAKIQPIMITAPKSLIACEGLITYSTCKKMATSFLKKRVTCIHKIFLD